MPKWDVLGFGAVAVDDLVYLDHFPAPDSKEPVRDEQRAGGGLAGTALVAAARLGVRAAYAGVLGDDDLSHYTIAELEREGVDCTLVRRQEGSGPVHSTIIVDRSTGERTILHYAARVVPPDESDVTPELIAQCSVLFVDSTVIAAGLLAAELAHRAGIPVVADLEHPGAPGVPELSLAADHLIVGATFARAVTGEDEPAAMVRGLHAPGRAATVVTVGDLGCWYAVGAAVLTVHHTPAYTVRAVDTTGCGDVFHGAYAAALARGGTVDRAVAVATIAAGLKATQPGGRLGIPDWSTVERVLVTLHQGRLA